MTRPHAPQPAPEPPAFLALAGHPLRWRLLRELAESDRRVWELTARAGRAAEPRLLPSGPAPCRRARVRPTAAPRIAATATTRRDLIRCGELLGAAGAALHPALRLRSGPSRGPGGVRPARVLFLCTGNSARSQMAEGLLQHLTAGRVQAFSAGSQPTRVHPNAVRVMRAHGVDLAGRRAKHFDEFLDQRFDCVVTVCDRVREVCPEFPGAQDDPLEHPRPRRERRHRRGHLSGVRAHGGGSRRPHSVPRAAARARPHGGELMSGATTNVCRDRDAAASPRRRRVDLP